MSPKVELLAVGLTGGILIGLVVLAHPSQVLLVSVTGAEQVSTADTPGFEAAIETPGRDGVDVDRLEYAFSTPDSEGVTAATVASAGTVTGVQASGTLDRIEASVLEGSARVERGPGHQTATGYGDRPTAVFRLVVEARAFEPGEYTLDVAVVTAEGRTFESNTITFEVVAATEDG
jgi:hypothetical protein